MIQAITERHFRTGLFYFLQITQDQKNKKKQKPHKTAAGSISISTFNSNYAGMFSIFQNSFQSRIFDISYFMDQNLEI